MKRQYIAAILAILMLLCIGCALNSTALKPQQELLTRFETFYMGSTTTTRSRSHSPI
jgi:hypothetical protein